MDDEIISIDFLNQISKTLHLDDKKAFLSSIREEYDGRRRFGYSIRYVLDNEYVLNITLFTTIKEVLFEISKLPEIRRVFNYEPIVVFSTKYAMWDFIDIVENY